MTWQTICISDTAPTPWRNGGGTTRELIAWPDAMAWQWRASVAEVAQSGAFSSFAGVQRWFAVLEGDGVCLTVDGRRHMLGINDAPLAFDGGAQTDCDLLGGTTQDFNLMLQAGASAKLKRVQGSYTTVLNTPKIVAACAYKERATVVFGTENHDLSSGFFGWAFVDAGTTVEVLSSNALFMEIEL